jgi:hypothetical protein
MAVDPFLTIFIKDIGFVKIEVEIAVLVEVEVGAFLTIFYI